MRSRNTGTEEKLTLTSLSTMEPAVVMTVEIYSLSTLVFRCVVCDFVHCIALQVHLLKIQISSICSLFYEAVSTPDHLIDLRMVG
jgi:hypothetical protein